MSPPPKRPPIDWRSETMKAFAMVALAVVVAIGGCAFLEWIILSLLGLN